MNFSQSVKQELIKITEMQDCCVIAELSAIIHTAGSIVRNSSGLCVEIVSQSDMSAFLESAINNLYGADIIEKWENNSFGKSNIYIVPAEISKSVLTDCGIIMYDEKGIMTLNDGIDQYLIQEDCCKAGFIRGAFLGGGSITGLLNGSFHMEFVMSTEKLSLDLSAMFKEMDIPVSTSLRRGKYIVYIKGGEKISDILALFGASRAVLRLNEQIVLREVKNRINRENNCLSANLNKMISAELKQLNAIKLIKDKTGLDLLPDKLKILAKFRLENENMSYGEIAETLNIAKSTVSHRMKRITEIAEKLRRENDV